MGWNRNAYKILVGRRESKRQFGLPRVWLGYKIITFLKIELENVGETFFIQYRNHTTIYMVDASLPEGQLALQEGLCYILSGY